MLDSRGILLDGRAYAAARNKSRRLAFPALPSTLVLLLAYGAIGLILRGALLGNPVVHIDEQFYLLVGERMREGALPFVDIWDRKPIGLFLLYEFADWLGAGGVLAYQLLALASVTLTALVIERIARQIAPPRGAFLAGVAYLLFLNVFNCVGGQTPVFYNLLMALAAWLLCSVALARESPALGWRGAGVMLLVGVSLQLKYSVLFEGVAFGLLLLLRAYADALSLRRIAGLALVWIGCALTPTLAAAAWYWNIGHLGEFMQANFYSIFNRQQPFGPALFRLFKEMTVLTPFWLAIFYVPRHFALRGGTRQEARSVLLTWGGAALFGFLVFGSWFDHYVAPLLVPLSVLAAPALARRGKGGGYGRTLIGFGMVAAVVVAGWNLAQRGNRTDSDVATAAITSMLHGGCLYVYEGEVGLYRTTHACIPTRFAFTSHLSSTVEARALGVDQNREVAAIMASRPAVVVMGNVPMHSPPNRATRAIVTTALARDYVPAGQVRFGMKEYNLFQRRDLAPRD